MTRFITHGQNNWQPRNSSVWQSERMRGPILPMERPSLFARIRAWLSRLPVDRREGVL